MTTAAELLRASDLTPLLRDLSATDDHTELAGHVRAALVAGNVPVAPGAPGGPDLIAASGIAVHVVTGRTAQPAQVRAWLGRSHPSVRELVLVTTRAVLAAGLPASVAGRVLHVVYLHRTAVAR